MIHFGGAGVVKDSRRIFDYPVRVDGHRDWACRNHLTTIILKVAHLTYESHGLLQLRLVTLSYVNVASGPHKAGVSITAGTLSFLIRIKSLRREAVFFGICKSLLHSSTAAAIVLVVAVHQLLLTYRDQGVVFQGQLSLQGSSLRTVQLGKWC